MNDIIFSKLSNAFSQGQLLSFTQLMQGEDISKDRLQESFEWFENITNQIFIKELLEAHTSFEEIIIHSPHNIKIKNGNDKSAPLTLSPQELQLSYEILASTQQLAWNYNEPLLSFSYKNRYRFTLLHHSATLGINSKLFIRSTPDDQITVKQFSSQSQANYIGQAITDKKNIIISGANSSGKTTLLKSLIHQLPIDQHLILLEDFHELTVNHPHCTHLIENRKNSAKTLSAYCSYVLRMAVDRLVIGEIRSSEVVPFIMAINTGTQGVLSTIHANSARDTIDRLTLLFSIYSDHDNIDFIQIEKLICQNIDVIIYLKDKKIDHMIEVKGHSDQRPLYKQVNLGQS